MEEFEKLDIPDYIMVMEAVEYREKDKAFWTHFLAWQTMRANGKKKAGKNGYKSAFPKFKTFYNPEAAMRNVRKNKDKRSGSSYLRGLSQFLKDRKGGNQ